MGIGKDRRIIGLTGGIACGKSTVAAMLREARLTVLDADAVSRAVTGPDGEAVPALKAEFAKYFDEEGRLDRGELASLVFRDKAARKRLEGILHPIVISVMEADTRAAFLEGKGPVIWDVPLLFESGMDARCGIVVCVSAKRETQIERLLRRNGLSCADAAARIDSQMPLKEKASRADIVIENNGNLAELSEAVRCFIETQI